MPNKRWPFLSDSGSVSWSDEHLRPLPWSCCWHGLSQITPSVFRHRIFTPSLDFLFSLSYLIRFQGPVLSAVALLCVLSRDRLHLGLQVLESCCRRAWGWFPLFLLFPYALFKSPSVLYSFLKYVWWVELCPPTSAEALTTPCHRMISHFQIGSW